MTILLGACAGAADENSKRKVLDMATKVRRILRAAPLLLAIGIFAAIAHSQNYLTSTGAPAFSAPEPVEMGFVDTSNGNLHLSIPLGSYPQRGTGQPEPVILEYDSNIWQVSTFSNWTPFWWTGNYPSTSNLGGWYISSLVDSQVTYWTTQNCTEDEYWKDSNGTVHSFHLSTNTQNSNCSAQADAFATDSSGYHMYVSTSSSPDTKVYAPDGTLAYAYSPLKDSQGNYILSEDSNGNYLSSSNITYNLIDTLGRQIEAGSFSGPVGTTPITVPTSQGTAQYTAVSTNINVKTNFQQSGVNETTTTIAVIRSVKLPDTAGSTYYFTYDCDSSTGNAACGSPSGQSAYYGELIRVTLPTGGTVDYSYTTFKDSYSNKSEWVSLRQAAGGDWTYTPAVLSTCSSTQVNCQQQTTVMSPTGTTIYTFQLNNGAWPIKIVQKDNQGNTVSTVNNAYDLSQACVLINCHGASFIRLTSQQTTVPISGGNLTKQTQYTYDSPQYGNRTAIKEWGYSSTGSFASVPDRATYISYNYYLGSNNINRPTNVALCNNSGSDSACPGGGSKVSQTLYYYDNYGTSGLTTISGVAQHDDAVFGAGYTTRGNVTSESQWVSGSAYLTSSYTYDTTGQILKATDQVGNPTYYSYSDSFFTDGGNNTTPSAYTPSPHTNAYRTSVIDAIGTQRMGYYWGSGKGATTTDYNGAATTAHYQDGLDRQTEEIDPVGWELATYTSATQSDMYTAVGDTSPSVGCSSCQHSQTFLDEWGRTASSILVNNPICQVTVEYTYDQIGQLQSQSHPNCGSSDPNHVFEAFGYDALGRQISTTHPDGQMQHVAFGANIGVLGGVTAQQGSASTYGYGYPQISEGESGHQHQEWIDGFGRIIEVDEPSTSTSSLATTTVSIASGGGQEWQTFNPCSPYGGNCPQTIPNSGYVYLTVDGYTGSANYAPNGDGTYMSASQVASSLAATFNADPNSPVTAAASGGSIVLTAKGPGTSGNFAFSSSETWYTGTCGSSPCFSGPVYAVSPSSGSLSGGSGGIGSSPLYTNYTYDAADHLTKVVQGVQTRTFGYDGLGRKISETTPEAGTVTYSYTTSGGALCSGDPSSVCRRTDARSVVSTYTYDSVNRLTGVNYTIPGGENIAAMPNVCTTVPNGTSANVCNYYDQGGSQAYAIGRLTEMIDPTGSETTTYYNDGHVKQVSKVTSGQTYSIGYKYDAGGDATQITYPSGRIIYQAYNSIGQLCLISPSSSGCSGTGYYAGNFSYNSPGSLTGFTYGNGVAAAFGYSAPRMQLSSLKYTFGTSTYFNLGYWYQQDSSNCLNGAAQNNGSIQCTTDSVNGGRTASYSYDPIGRLSTAKTNGSTGYPQWGVAESYDRYGNRLSQTVTAGSGPSSNLSF
ncbi:MAG TPA: hypothetical protein VG225_08415, partial [Terracidiphilus sp.]|nr:hypothetical protein [Terracidiphilus sp.]